MNIKARIVARKITLIYFYEQYFVRLAWNTDSMIVEIDKISADIEAQREEGDNWIAIQDLTDEYYDNLDAEIAYIAKQHFSNVAPKDIDFKYIQEVAPHFADHIDTVEKAVDMFATTFKFADMDVMDRVIFILWYVEYTLLKTPKEVVLNEMIELAKRYGDESSPKLLNWIGHKVLTSYDEAASKAPKSAEESETKK